MVNVIDLDHAVQMVIETLKESIEHTSDPDKVKQIMQANQETRIFGGGGLVDSLGIVILVAELEEKLDEEHNVQVSLASEAAMSGTRSPFRTVKSLATHIVSVVTTECAS